MNFAHFCVFTCTAGQALKPPWSFCLVAVIKKGQIDSILPQFNPESKTCSKPLLKPSPQCTPTPHNSVKLLHDLKYLIWLFWSGKKKKSNPFLNEKWNFIHSLLYHTQAPFLIQKRPRFLVALIFHNNKTQEVTSATLPEVLQQTHPQCLTGYTKWSFLHSKRNKVFKWKKISYLNYYHKPFGQKNYCTSLTISLEETDFITAIPEVNSATEKGPSKLKPKLTVSLQMLPGKCIYGARMSIKEREYLNNDWSDSSINLFHQVNISRCWLFWLCLY